MFMSQRSYTLLDTITRTKGTIYNTTHGGRQKYRSEKRQDPNASKKVKRKWSGSVNFHPAPLFLFIILRTRGAGISIRETLRLNILLRLLRTQKTNQNENLSYYAVRAPEIFIRKTLGIRKQTRASHYAQKSKFE